MNDNLPEHFLELFLVYEFSSRYKFAHDICILISVIFCLLIYVNLHPDSELVSEDLKQSLKELDSENCWCSKRGGHFGTILIATIFTYPYVIDYHGVIGSRRTQTVPFRTSNKETTDLCASPNNSADNSHKPPANWH